MHFFWVFPHIWIQHKNSGFFLLLYEPIWTEKNFRSLKGPLLILWHKYTKCGTKRPKWGTIWLVFVLSEAPTLCPKSVGFWKKFKISASYCIMHMHPYFETEVYRTIEWHVNLAPYYFVIIKNWLILLFKATFSTDYICLEVVLFWQATLDILNPPFIYPLAIEVFVEPIWTLSTPLWLFFFMAHSVAEYCFLFPT